jgi:hypothetical protein
MESRVLCGHFSVCLPCRQSEVARSFGALFRQASDSAAANNVNTESHVFHSPGPTLVTPEMPQSAVLEPPSTQLDLSISHMDFQEVGRSSDEMPPISGSVVVVGHQPQEAELLTLLRRYVRYLALILRALMVWGFVQR